MKKRSFLVLYSRLFSILTKNGKYVSLEWYQEGKLTRLSQNYKAIFNFNIRIPPPTLPSFSLVSEILGDSISLAIVSFAINISMAKLFAKKYKYEISPNQVNERSKSNKSF